jgi:hypothetical protein
MTVKDYIAQEEKIRNIASQDISMFEKTTVRNVFAERK